VVRFPEQFLRRTELIKRSLRPDDEPTWWCLEPLHSRCAFLVSPHPMPLTDEEKTFNLLLEENRKDVERLFNVLIKRFHIALHPGRCRSVKQLIMTYKAVCILHNMCVEARRDTFLSRRRYAPETNGGGSAGSEGEGPASEAAAAAGGKGA